jgi:PPE-repeat protein
LAHENTIEEKIMDKIAQWEGWMNWVTAQYNAGTLSDPPSPSPSPSVLYPTVDVDGCIYPPEFKGTPIENYRCRIQDTLDQPGLSDQQKFWLGQDFNQNFQITIQERASINDPLDQSLVTVGHNFILPLLPSGHPQQDFTMLVFPRDNPAPGNSWTGFHYSDCAAFVTRCQQTGIWPIRSNAGNPNATVGYRK